MITILDSPGTETKKMLSESKLGNPEIKNAPLFHNVLRRELKKKKETVKASATVAEFVRQDIVSLRKSKINIII